MQMVTRASALDECLDDEVLAQFVARTLSASDDARVRSHVDRCPSCRRLLADAVAATSHVSTEEEPAPPTRVDPNIIDPFVPGTIIDGKYRIDRIVGGGGMGSVMAATHLELGHAVAIKVMNADEAGSSDSMRRFMREGRAAAQLRSDHALRIFDVGRLPSGVPFLVMEYLEGEDLEQITRRRAPSVHEAVEWVRQAAHALAEAHDRGLIHRDLKPSNLFLTRLADGKPRIKVVDFGLVKDLSLGSVKGDKKLGRLTSENMMLGSPFFMSPEQIRTPNRVDARSDVWSLAATLFKLLAGQPPFVAPSTHGVLAKILNEEAPRVKTLRADVPPIVDDTIAKALSRDPQRRFASVTAFVSALDTGSVLELGHESDAVEVTTPIELPRMTPALSPTLDATRKAAPDTEPQRVAPTALSPGMGPKTTAPFAKPVLQASFPPRTEPEPRRPRSIVVPAVGVALVLAALAAAGAVVYTRRPAPPAPSIPTVIAVAPPESAPAATPTPTLSISAAPPPPASASVAKAEPPPPKPHPVIVHKAPTPSPPASKPSGPPSCPPSDPYCWSPR